MRPGLLRGVYSIAEGTKHGVQWSEYGRCRSCHIEGLSLSLGFIEARASVRGGI